MGKTNFYIAINGHYLFCSIWQHIHSKRPQNAIWYMDMQYFCPQYYSSIPQDVHCTLVLTPLTFLFNIIWASTRENLSSEVCEKRRRRPACASAQSDQPLYYSHFEKYNILTCYKQNHGFLASPCSLEDWFESYFVENP